MRRGWPGGRRPPSLAAAAPGDAVRQWGRLGYPRRALRLHATARDPDRRARRRRSRPPSTALLALPGVGLLHRGRRGQLRVRAAPRGAGHQRAAGAGPPGHRRRTSRRAAHRPPRSRWPSRCCPTSAAAGRALVGRGHGARRAGLHRGPARLRPAARWRGSAPGCRAGRPPPPCGPAAPALRGQRPAVPRAACSRCCGRPAGRSRRPASTPPGRTRRSGRGRWTALIADGLATALADGMYALPGQPGLTPLRTAEIRAAGPLDGDRPRTDC